MYTLTAITGFNGFKKINKEHENLGGGSDVGNGGWNQKRG